MTDKKNKFLTVKEASILTGKSESTIKRLVHKTKVNSNSSVANKEYFKFEVLPTGSEKIYVSEKFLKTCFSIVQMTDKTKSIESNDFVDFLKGQIEKKDEQIELLNQQIINLIESQKELIERQRESNILLGKNVEIKQIEQDARKKRWWQIK